MEKKKKKFSELRGKKFDKTQDDKLIIKEANQRQKKKKKNKRFRKIYLKKNIYL